MRKVSCPFCLSIFKTKHPNKKYCSSVCQEKASSENEWNKRKINPRERCIQLCSMAKNRAKIKSLDYNIDGSYLLELWNSQDGKCSVSGLEFDLKRPGDGLALFNAPSLDRINPSEGYIKGNVRLVCYQVNAGMQHYGSEHFIKLCETVVNYQRQVA